MGQGRRCKGTPRRTEDDRVRKSLQDKTSVHCEVRERAGACYAHQETLSQRVKSLPNGTLSGPLRISDGAVASCSVAEE